MHHHLEGSEALIARLDTRDNRVRVLAFSDCICAELPPERHNVNENVSRKRNPVRLCVGSGQLFGG